MVNIRFSFDSLGEPQLSLTEGDKTVVCRGHTIASDWARLVLFVQSSAASEQTAILEYPEEPQGDNYAKRLVVTGAPNPNIIVKVSSYDVDTQEPTEGKLEFKAGITPRSFIESSITALESIAGDFANDETNFNSAPFPELELQVLKTIVNQMKDKEK
jgi:hypothetical protein